MATATVKWWNPSKGFGFLKDTATGNEYFCHHSQILDMRAGARNLEEGATVTYEEQPSQKGPAATAVRVIGARSPDAPAPVVVDRRQHLAKSPARDPRDRFDE